MDDRHETLVKAKKNLGFIPNMYRNMATAPGLLESYLYTYEQFRENADFTPVEQEVVFLTISRENGCTYCMAAHSLIADKMSNVPTEVTDAIRDDLAIPDSKLSSLHAFTKAMHDTTQFTLPFGFQHFSHFRVCFTGMNNNRQVRFKAGGNMLFKVFFLNVTR
jgi:AhpD family alkylhydroperoxidase